jgi:hypothetical protein
VVDSWAIVDEEKEFVVCDRGRILLFWEINFGVFEFGKVDVEVEYVGLTFGGIETEECVVC